jgi:hypothetical protein
MWDDIIGAHGNYDIIGAEDIIGANVALGQQYDSLDAQFGNQGYPFYVGQGQAPQQALVDPRQLGTALASHHSAMVQQRQFTKARRYPLGFPTTVIAAGAVALINSNPQVPFRSGRLVVPSDIAGAVLINDIRVGKNSSLANANPVPGRMFTETAVGMDLNFDTAQISQTITLNVTNTSAAPITFNAGIMGTAVE